MRKYKEKLVAFILSVIMVLFIWHNFLVSGNNIIFIFILISSFFLIKNSIIIKNKRADIIASIIAIMFALIEIICKSINYDYTLNHILDKWILINFIGYFTISFVIIKGIYYYLDIYNKEDKKKKYGFKINFLNNNYYMFVCFFLLILIAWIPYLLRYYPGIVTADSISTIEQSMGRMALSDHHPIAYTAIVSFCLNIGMLLFKNIKTSIALYSIVSMICMALFDSVVLLYLKKKNTHKTIVIGALLIYMFYPVNAIYSITMWKDILFSGLFPIFLILCNELIFHTDLFLKSKKNISVFVMVSFLMIVLRHNGLYVVVLSLPLFYIPLKKYWKKLSWMFFIIIIINQIFNTIAFSILKVEKGSIGEMLSIPLQQIARVEKKHREELSEDILNRINNIFITERIGDYYDPTLSDSVKWKLDIKYIKQNKIEFLKVWMKLLSKYPKEYIESFISNSYGYYYPEAFYSVVFRKNIDYDMKIEQSPKIEGKIIEKIDSLIDKRDIPLNSMFYSIGMGFWIIIICFGYKMYKKEYKYILLYLPIFVLWLTCIASPVFCEYRYAYPIFTSILLYISLNVTKENEKIKDNN